MNTWNKQLQANPYSVASVWQDSSIVEIIINIIRPHSLATEWHTLNLNVSSLCNTMIYLILTTSIRNRFGAIEHAKRKERYLSAIQGTLSHLPACITPIIVENNGKRETYLDYFLHDGKPVRVVYTNNNEIRFHSKATNEMADIKDVVRECGIQTNDMIIKLTGRYRMVSSDFFTDVIEHEKIDAFVKFYNVVTMKHEYDDCVLGCFAMRVIFIQLYPHHLTDIQPSAEVAFAQYVRRCVTLKEMDDLGVECCFAEDDRIVLI